MAESAQNSQTRNQPDASSNEPVIQLRDVCLQFGDARVLDGINLDVHANEVVAVLGPSGSGKSTLIKIISGLLIPDSGEVKLASQNIGLAFQYGALFTSMTVADNIWLILQRTTDLDDKEIQQRIHRYLEIVGLGDAADKRPSELSGGMQKRVGIARALAIHPQIMLYDEPSAGLDPIIGNKLEQDMKQANRELNMATIVVTHEMPTIENLADRVVLLYKGKFVYEGTKDDFMTTDEPHAYQFRNRKATGPINV